jgi:hypothetical protein
MKDILPEIGPFGTPQEPPESFCRAAQQAASGRQVRTGIRQSIPSNSIEIWAEVSETEPSLACGQTNRPFSNRL